MLSKPEARQAILSMILDSYPRDIWPTLGVGTAGAYHDAWASTRDDPRFSRVPGQRRFRAPQERHFLMEGMLADVAARCAVPFAAEVVKTNQWVYGMIRGARVCIMQKKVGDTREPPPADFRQQIAAANMFVRQGDLLELDDRHASGDLPVYGILIHAPASQRFVDPGYGTPAFAYLAFAFGDYSGWAAKLTLEEIIAAYPSEREEKPAQVKPVLVWKKPEQDDKKDGTSGGE